MHERRTCKQNQSEFGSVCMAGTLIGWECIPYAYILSHYPWGHYTIVKYISVHFARKMAHNFAIWIFNIHLKVLSQVSETYIGYFVQFLAMNNVWAHKYKHLYMPRLIVMTSYHFSSLGRHHYWGHMLMGISLHFTALLISCKWWTAFLHYWTGYY